MALRHNEAGTRLLEARPIELSERMREPGVNDQVQELSSLYVGERRFLTNQLPYRAFPMRTDHSCDDKKEPRPKEGG